MLPGIRFLLAAILLSMSILIFGLGAAALLRAAHEEVANVPTRRIMPEPVFAHQPEAPVATLAMLRIEPSAPARAPESAPAAMVAPEPAVDAPVPGLETEKLAALKGDDIAPAEAEKPEAAVKPEAAPNSESATMETPAPPSAAAEPSPATETRFAALDAAPSPPIETAPVPSATSDAGTTITAALGDAAATIEKTADATAKEKADRDELRRKRRAERARERRRQAARRARIAAQLAAAAAAQQQVLDPITQMTQVVLPIKPAVAITTRR